MTHSTIALITGGTGGVGQALLARLRAKGLRVAAATYAKQAGRITGQTLAVDGGFINIRPLVR